LLADIDAQGIMARGKTHTNVEILSYTEKERNVYVPFKKTEREAMVMLFYLAVATAVQQAKMPCTASAGIREFDGTRLITDFSVVEQTNTQKQNNRNHALRSEKHKADRKARGLQPSTRNNRNSSCGKDDTK